MNRVVIGFSFLPRFLYPSLMFSIRQCGSQSQSDIDAADDIPLSPKKKARAFEQLTGRSGQQSIYAVRENGHCYENAAESQQLQAD